AVYSSQPAISKINRLKQRAQSQPLSIMVNSIGKILEISGVQNEWVQNFLGKILPGAVTVLLPRRRISEHAYWNRFPLLGFRYPNHRLSTLLVSLVEQPLITTSANLSGEPPVQSVAQLPAKLVDNCSLVVDGGETRGNIASTIIQIDIEQRTISLVRPGATPWEFIENCFVHI
ncbi:MAG TPA: hypothetical protein ENK14_02395, partial [Caldithrix sp.]|nr:hypothetical protein [Caldithrix sp.]